MGLEMGLDLGWKKRSRHVGLPYLTWKLKAMQKWELASCLLLEEIAELVGSEQWSLSKRFALYQGEERKIRIIDNYRDSGVNGACSSSH